MTRETFSIEHEFVERLPAERRERTLYVSIPFATAVHSCMCGCGAKIVTPISPPQWKLTFDGDTVSLWPSIGSSGLACRSHYVIERNRVHWAPSWTDKQIASGRARDRTLRDHYYVGASTPSPPTPAQTAGTAAKDAYKPGRRNWLQRLLDLFR